MDVLMCSMRLAGSCRPVDTGTAPSEVVWDSKPKEAFVRHRLRVAVRAGLLSEMEPRFRQVSKAASELTFTERSLSGNNHTVAAIVFFSVCFCVDLFSPFCCAGQQTRKVDATDTRSRICQSE